MYAEPISLARREAGDVAMPDEARRLRERDARLRAALVEQAQVDALSDLAEEREVDAGPVVRCAERIWLARPDLQLRRI
jgi:hypothetical protein